MSSNTLLILQSIGVALQMCNATLATIIKSEPISLLVAAAIGGYQFYVQHVGNQTAPPSVDVEPPK